MANSFGKQIVTNGLVLCYDAANKRSYSGAGTSVTDLSSRGNTGTLINGVGFSTNNGGAFVFDGVNDRGTFSTPFPSPATPQTYEVWAKVSSPGLYGYILHNNETDPNIGGSYMTIGLSNQEIFGAFNGMWTLMMSGVIVSNKPVQIVLKTNTSNQSLYINGVHMKTQGFNTGASFSAITSFGDYKGATYRPISGNIYIINIYNKDLDATEIQQNFQALRGRFGI